MKLSKTQREVVEEMKKGAIIVLMVSIEGHAFLSGSRKTVSLATLWALEKKGVVEATEEDHNSRKYELTEKGYNT